MKIAFFEIRDSEQGILEESLKQNQLTFFQEPLNEKNLQQITDADIISTHTDSKLSKEITTQLKNLKFIATRTTGFDHIDLQETKARNIPVSNVPAYGEVTVAEFTIALLLAVSRKINLCLNDLKQKTFNTKRLQGFDLEGKTLGVVGTGKIGQHVIKIANGFAMKIIAYDAYPKEELQQSLHFQYVDYDTVLKDSDIITFHTPALPSTYHLINKEALLKIKKGMVVINTSRGSVIDTCALLEGLENGTFLAAGLDVLEEEKAFRGDINEINNENIEAAKKLLDLENVIITPHNAFNTKEAEQRIMATTIENINSFLSGTPKNIIS